ncbi:unnamed protein product [Closterium sp. NIES-53]
MTTLRVLLHVAAQRDYELHSLDFSTAFLQGSLHEEIWLRRPPGFTGSFPVGTEWSLRRPIYGLRQAPREWHDTLRTTLAALGFASSTSDPSLFLRTNTTLPPFYVLVYVYDLVFATADTEALAHVKSELQKRHTSIDLGTYVDEAPPPGANIFSGMWIFRGVDFFQTFSPTPKLTTLRVLLHVAAQRDYELHSLDFSTAFLQGSLHEEIWLRRPPGFTGSFPVGTEWSLRRPIYGLRQAPREWHDTLRTTLAALGFASSTSDPSLFLRTNTTLPPFYVLVYVYDLVFATADTEALAHVKSELQKRHTSIDLGTYVDEAPPPGANIFSGMWIFRGVDFFQTFSPTPKLTTLRVLLHVAAQRDYELHSLDFSTAFLQGSLHEEIWLRRPPGFTGSFPVGTEWSLRRPIYGLRQAPREWHDTLRTTLAALGFASSTSDPSLFLRTNTTLPPFYVLVYVYDLVFATADTEALAHVKSELQKRHTSIDLGTYVDEAPPPGANIFSGMWIFRGVDFFQTFSPTPKLTTLRVLLHVAAQRDYELHSLDFSTAFLQGSLHEEIWLRRPPGFTGSFPVGTEWSLRRPIYGLRQAPREWHDTLRTTLAALGFASSTSDPSLFLRTNTTLPPFYVLVYVYDLVFATADTEALAHVNLLCFA